MTQRRQAALWLLDYLAHCDGYYGTEIADMIDHHVPIDLRPMFEASRNQPCPAFRMLKAIGVIAWDTFGVFVWLTEKGRSVAGVS